MDSPLQRYPMSIVWRSFSLRDVSAKTSAFAAATEKEV
jgi:hypothetical protein